MAGHAQRAVFPAVCGAGVLNLSIWLLISLYLYVDTLSGVMTGTGGGQAPLSQAWKGIIFLLILIVSIRRSLRTVMLITLLGLALLLAPLYRLFTTPYIGSAIWEMTTALKVLLPVAVLSWCNDQRLAGDKLLQIWPRRALWLAVSALFLNILLGAAGFGYATYRAGGVNIGIIGFFTAGNEIGALFAVLCGFVLMETWTKYRKLYVVSVAIFIATGFAIATKSAMLSAVLLAVLVPVVYHRERWDRLPAGAAVAMAIIFIFMLIAAVQIWTVLEAAGLSEKLRAVYSSRGWVGILFSGRDTFIANASEAILTAHSFSDVLFGPGAHKLRMLDIKESIEIDPLDFYLWFGIPGLLVGFVFAILFLYIPLQGKKDRLNTVAPAVAVTTWLMLAISVIAGHVIIAGIPGIAWATFTALVFTSGRVPAPATYTGPQKPVPVE